MSRIIVEEKHGFCLGRYTILPVILYLIVMSYVFNVFNQRSQVNVLFTNINNAFDLVNHEILLKVVKASEFGESPLS